MRSLPFAVPVGAGWTEGDLRDADDVEELVRAFYRRAATDGLLGPVFEAAGVDWSAHIPKLVEFWSWQLFGTPGYEGQPLLAHRPLQAATPFREAHYARWLEIFDDTVDERFAGPLAEAAKARAAKMATALRRLLADCPADTPDTPATPGEAAETGGTAG